MDSIKIPLETASSASFIEIYLKFTQMAKFLPDLMTKERTSNLP